MQAHYVAGLDIGTAEVKLVVAEEREGHLVPRLFLRSASHGVRKGAVVEVAELVPVLERLFAEAKLVDKNVLRNLYVNIGTTQIAIQASRGIVAVSRADAEIYQDDIDRVIKASQALNLGPNRQLIHNVVREFVVDGTSDIVDPLGLTGSRLEVQSLVVDAFALHVKNVMRAVELAGGVTRGLAFSPLAASRAALSRRKKDLGAALVDLGAGTTGVSIFEEGKLVGVAQLPIGGAMITHDLAIGLKVPVAEAEQVKVEHGAAIAKQVAARDTIALQHGESGKPVTKKFVAEIIESRLAEVFELVEGELAALGKAGRLAEGVVLVGGGARLPGIVDLARRELKLSCEVGSYVHDSWLVETAGLDANLDAPEFAVAVGLALWGIQNPEDGPARRGFKAPSFKPKGWLRYFMP